MYRVTRLAVVFALLLFCLPLCSQQPAQNDPCGLPSFPKLVNEANLFNDQQEEWLGEFMDAGFRREFNAIEDPDGYMQALGERLLAQLPPTKMRYRFAIVDSPELNSFGLAGGRIYIFRKLIAMARNEDELAALLGHEIGHIVTHQAAIDVTRWFSELGIREVGDKQDIFRKWNQLYDNAAKLHVSHSEKRELQEQLIADRIGMYALARAGYQPSRDVEFFDRLAETKGKTGGFWSDLFGKTSPDSRRLRELMRNTAALPASCVTAAPAGRDAAFSQWQRRVIEANTAVASEVLPGLVRKVPLQPPLRGDLQYLKFSPDGNYLLAQDEASVFVLSSAPLANLFRIDSEQAFEAQFTPDSKSIIVYDKELRIQAWDLAGRKRVSIQEMSASCWQKALSPRADILACITPEMDLQLIDVPSGKPFFSRKNFYQFGWLEAFLAELALSQGEEPPALFTLRFSPEGTYFLVARGDFVLGYDLKARAEIKLPRNIKQVAASDFIFLSSGELLGTANGKFNMVARVRFPSGEPIDEFKVPFLGSFLSVTRENYVVVKAPGPGVNVLDIAAKKITLGYKQPGFAVNDRFIATETVGGEVALYNMSDKKMLSVVHLPSSPLAFSKASAFSFDGTWLAVSGQTRGAIWKLENGARVMATSSFDGVFFEQDHLFAKFGKNGENPAQMYKITPATLGEESLYKLEKQSGGTTQFSFTGFGFSITSIESGRQKGEVLTSMRLDEKGKRWTMEVRDVRNNNLLWEYKTGKSVPKYFYSPGGKTLTFVVADYDDIKAAAKADGAVAARLNAIAGSEGKKASYLLQTYDCISGKLLGFVLVDTGKLSFKVSSAYSIGDTVLVSDSVNRTLIYSLKSGEQRGKVFGHAVAVSPKGDMALIENAKGVADLYETASVQSRGHFTFASAIRQADFTGDGSLLVLTAEQTVYQMRPSAAPENARQQ